MNKLCIISLLLPGIGLITPSCKNTAGSENVSDLSVKQSGDTVFLSSAYPSKNKIILENIGFRSYSYSFTTTGVVRPMTGQLAEISAPFEGRVMSSYVRLGEKVKKGAPVFGLSSPEYFEAIKNLQQSDKEREAAQSNFNRKKELMDQGVVSRKDFEEALLSLEVSNKAYEKAYANLKIFNVEPGNADFSHPLTITSPISGEVVNISLTLGQYLKTDSEPVVVIANLDNVWVVAHIKEKDLGKINLKDHVDIVTESLPDKPFGGSVEYISGIMEDQTRSVEVFIECRNTDKLIKPGMFVTANFRHNVENALIIPSTAILQEEDRTFVFKKVTDNMFVKKTVSVASIENHNMLVTSGLSNGDVIISEGGIYLR